MVLCLLTLARCSSAPVASTTWKSDCGSIDAEIKYCYHEIGQPDLSKPVIVFMHGLEDSEQVFLHPTSVPSSYPDLIAAMPVGSRIFVLSWGPGWLLTSSPRDKAPLTATLERFKAVLLGRSPGPFRLMGHSMGGANAARLAEAYPELFTKVILINPMLVTDDNDPWNVIQICPACLLIKPNYDGTAQWKSDRPEPAAQAAASLVTACPIDIFALYSGAEEYVVKSRKLGNKVTMLDDPAICTHWSFPVPEIVKFLSSP